MIVVGFLFAVLALYVGSYFAGELTDGTTRDRYFRHEWQCRIYCPLAWLESEITGTTVCIWRIDDASADCRKCYKPY